MGFLREEIQMNESLMAGKKGYLPPPPRLLQSTHCCAFLLWSLEPTALEAIVFLCHMCGILGMQVQRGNNQQQSLQQYEKMSISASLVQGAGTAARLVN